MQLVLEVCNADSSKPAASKTFEGVGGVIGRGTDCDWVLHDETRLVSNHHGLVSYRGGRYFLTDISSNGIGVAGAMERLCRGQARLINEGEVYQLGTLDIRARFLQHQRQRLTADGMIPDDAFLGLDPVLALDREQPFDVSTPELQALSTTTQVTAQALFHGTVDRDHLVVPKWAEPAEAAPVESVTAMPVATEPFWSLFGEALGMSVDTLDTSRREALAIKAAGLLRQAIEGLQQNLRTRDELNSELNVMWSIAPYKHPNPLSDCADAQAAMTLLLGNPQLGQLSAEQTVAQANRDIQVHQLALIVACRAAVRGALAALSPDQLLLALEREGKPSRFFSDGSHWRAYQRHYRRLIEEESQAERLLRTDFSKAYGEQVRLVSTLHAAYQG